MGSISGSFGNCRPTNWSRETFIHYVKGEWSGYTECYCGHCTYPRQKVRKPDDSCEHFERKVVFRRFR